MTTAPTPLRTDAPSTGLPPVPLLGLALFAVAANMRVAISSVPPLRDAIVADLHLSNAGMGALTTLPVL
jgi:MFS transporter, CP family, cyanate transporter